MHDPDHPANAVTPPTDAVTWPLTVVTAPGLQQPLAEELRTLVDCRVSDRPFGATLEATPTETYRIVCDSLIAGHVYVAVATGEGGNADRLYALGRSVDWSALFPVDATLAITATGTTEDLRHTGFIITRLKDAIVDQFREQTGVRPSVDTRDPAIRIHCHLTQAGFATLNVELSNGSLHRRGYRTEGGIAPLRENLAAAVLWRARWQTIAAEGGALFDPMCGSGTLLIEAALRLKGLTAQMRTRRIGSSAWLDHDRVAMNAVLAESPAGLPSGDAPTQPMLGQDIDPQQIAAARNNARRAGVDDLIHFSVADAWESPCPKALNDCSNGLLLSNLPYGQRLPRPDDKTSANRWHQLVDRWQQCLAGWAWAVLLPQGMGNTWPLRYEKAFDFDNGGTPISLLRGVISAEQRRETPGPRGLAQRLLSQGLRERETIDAAAFTNRLRKNVRHLNKVAQRAGWTCYRLYDADLPDFNFAIDLYQDEAGDRWLNLQEYQAPVKIDPKLARARLAAALVQAHELLNLQPDHLLVRQRRRQSGSGQYQRMAQERIRRVVREGPADASARLWVNLSDYLDTGLFLDHRLVRDRVAELARGKSLLNLFCYTATASVRAAVAGASTTLSIDLSKTYLDWAAENFRLNEIEVTQDDDQARRPHRLKRADVLEWLRTASARPEARSGFDVIFCDPPSFSNSKAMQDVLDIQRDHEEIVRQCMRLLRPHGVLIFSNNRKGFKLGVGLVKDFQVDDISRKTLPDDFARSPDRRSVFQIRHR